MQKDYMKKLIIFDLDGVLCDSPDMHYETFTKAYREHSGIHISKKEHDFDLNGRSTRTKLSILKSRDNLPDTVCDKIWEAKQKLTFEYIEKMFTRDDEKIKILKYLKSQNYKIACASNAIKLTILKILKKLEIIEYFDLILSNEDVNHPKPSAEIYLKAMLYFNCNPSNTLIVEDSKIGYEGALSTRADVLRVINARDLTLQKILNKLNTRDKTMKEKFKNEKLNVVIPMAGAGSRFEKAGYTFPKPLIEMQNKTMIQVVCESLSIDANYVFIAREEHEDKYNITNYLKNIIPDCNVVLTDGLTEGAACTVLLAKEFINNDNPIIMANSDQYIEWDVFEFMKNNYEKDLDASMLVFKSNHPKWSYAKVNDMGLVTEVAEKNPISDIATVGVYYWKKGADFCNYANQMIKKNIRVNNEFYVCPVFNEAIEDNKKIGVFEVEEMWGLGTPEDLENFLKHKS